MTGKMSRYTARQKLS